MTKHFYDITLKINLSSIEQNYKILQKKIFPNICAATIKADAYGLGAEKISKSLYKAGCRNFYVATLNEAIDLRNIIKDCTIFVFHGVKDDECEAFFKYDLIPVINDNNQLKIWNLYAHKIKQKLKANLHFDTGLNRLGMNNFDINEIINDKSLLDQIDIQYLMTHFSCSNENNSIRNKEQLDSFNIILKKFKNLKSCISNSSAIFLGKEYHFEMVRPGAALFGINPTPYNNVNPMKKVITLESKIIHIKNVENDGMVGYGNIAPVKKGMKIAVIPVGYADGYMRSLTNKSYCYLKNKKIPTLGRISMDLTVIDISSFENNEISVGDNVEIIGENINISDLAKQANTIPYEILTSFSSRLQKIYIT